VKGGSFGGEEVEPGIAYLVCIILAEVVRVCRYCYGFSDDAYTVVMDDNYDFCSVTAGDVQDPLLTY
jgi:hypothetical protein